MLHDWLIPDWPAPSHVRAVCTTRVGGVSQGNYKGLNLGDHVGDAPEDVAANRLVLRDAIRARPVFMEQVHGVHVAMLESATPDRTQADACMTMQRGMACTIMVADCLPVLLTDGRGSAVAAAHAGWRGLAGGVLEAAVQQLGAVTASGGKAMLAWLGPCIGPDAFEVGNEVRAAFMADDPRCAAMFRAHTPGKWLADLQGLARLRLQRSGITALYGNDGSRDWCTVGNPSRFFSHRRDRVSGRFAAGIWLA